MEEIPRIGLNPARLDPTQSQQPTPNSVPGVPSSPSNRRESSPTGCPVPERHPACDGRKPSLQPSLCLALLSFAAATCCLPLPLSLALIHRLLRSSCTCTCRSSAPLVSVQSCLILRHHPPCHPAPPPLYHCGTPCPPTYTNTSAYKHTHIQAGTSRPHLFLIMEIQILPLPSYHLSHSILSSLRAQHTAGTALQDARTRTTRQRLLQCNPSLHEDQDDQDNPKSQFRC
jgi:hypothetical protein